MSDRADGPCPRCTGTGKRWRMLDGTDVCDECWLDTAMDRQAMHWREARAALPAPVLPVPFKRLARRREWPIRDARPTVDRCAETRDPRWKAALAKLITPSYNSICILCGHIFYGATMASCSRCGGMCKLHTDHDLGLMARHATVLVEAEG
jgi:hypothetical protein